MLSFCNRRLTARLRAQGHQASRAGGFARARFRRRQASRAPGFVGTRLYGREASRVGGFAGTRIRGHQASRAGGFAAAQANGGASAWAPWPVCSRCPHHSRRPGLRPAAVGTQGCPEGVRTGTRPTAQRPRVPPGVPGCVPLPPAAPPRRAALTTLVGFRI